MLSKEPHIGLTLTEPNKLLIYTQDPLTPSHDTSQQAKLLHMLYKDELRGTGREILSARSR